MTAYYRNETLFSEIYLDEITRQPEHQDVLASLRVLREYRDYADRSSLAAWTQSYIHEVLAALGFSAQEQRAGLTLLYPMGHSDQPVSLCVVTLPTESLDETRMGRNWAEKTIRALREQAMQWGLLTNGKSWRIYHLDEATPYETYLEINLEQILSDQAREAYQIFHKFMKAGNFSAGEAGKCQFDRFKQESKDKIDYIEKELANALKQREEGGKGVLSDLCLGYVEEVRQSGEYDLDDEILRRKIYHGAMLYMFRLLFLFYAEARGLLSDENEALLAAVKADANATHNGETGQGSNYALWERLSAIFVDIDQTYNGGLFSPQESEFTQFIEETRAADRYLAETLFNLTTYREKNGQERPISYRDMSVRHLGTLYEGLLEHKLFITAEATEVRVTKGKIEFIPVSHGGKLAQGHYLAAGAVYFAGDPSERKSTGSYYTPEYIVDYIVRNTVGEKLKALKAEFIAQEKANLEALARAVDADERAALAGLLEENALAFVREHILTLSVLDPAMGSGHFLVNVTNLIANFISAFLNDLGVEGETESGTAHWRRWVVENCIYGVDLNPLAVELAKLALWILSMAKDQPLSFTNHHLKCGNSLVGARLDEIGNYPFSIAKKQPRQLNMFVHDQNFRTAVEDALTKARLIASRASISLADVEEKKAWLAEIEADLKGYKAICNVHTGLYFGNLVDENEYTRLVEKRDFASAFALEKPDRYFHWELEFPEIFMDTDYKSLINNIGFDVTIGNPPYIRPHNLDESTKQALWNFFPTTYQAKSDILNCFIQRGIDLLQDQGILGMITADSWLILSSATGLREYVLENTKIMSLGVLPKKVFDEASVSTGIVQLRKESNRKNRLTNQIIVVDVYSESIIANYTQKSYNTTEEKTFFTVSQPIYDLRIKVEDKSVPVGDVVDVSFGLKTGDDSKFLKTERSSDEDKPLVSSKSIGRFNIDWDGVYVWYVPQKMIAHRSTARPGEAKRFEQDKVIVNRMSERLSCTLDTDNFYVKDALLIHKTTQYSLGYLATLLNSKLLDKHYSSIYTTLDLHRNELLRIPIRKIAFVTPRNTLENELAHAQQLYLDGRKDELLGRIHKWLTNTPEQADIVQDLLSYLAEKMVENSKERQSRTKEFLHWLEMQIGANLDALTGKTIIQNYLGDYQKDQQPASFDEILAVLSKNQRCLQVDVSDVTFQNRLESEYQSSLQTLLPIKERLAATDRLIDQIVYQLYGLTEEEIAVVEIKG